MHSYIGSFCSIRGLGFKFYIPVLRMIIIIVQIYKAPMSKIESEALVRAATRGMGERLSLIHI